MNYLLFCDHTHIIRKPIKIFIGNVPHEATSKDLRAVFEDSGLEIHKCDKVSHAVDVEKEHIGNLKMLKYLHI